MHLPSNNPKILTAKHVEIKLVETTQQGIETYGVSFWRNGKEVGEILMPYINPQSIKVIWELVLEKERIINTTATAPAQPSVPQQQNTNPTVPNVGASNLPASGTEASEVESRLLKIEKLLQQYSQQSPPEGAQQVEQLRTSVSGIVSEVRRILKMQKG